MTALSDGRLKTLLLLVLADDNFGDPLRKKVDMGQPMGQPKLIHTVRGVGYRICDSAMTTQPPLNRRY